MKEGRNGSVLPQAVAVILAVVVTAGTVVLMVLPGERDENGVVKDGPDLETILNHRNLGIAYLENNDLDEADAAFVKLAELVPDERIGFQNLAISRLMKIDPEIGVSINKSREPELYEAARVDAEQAILTLEERFPDLAETHILSSRYSRLMRQTPTSIDQLTIAAEHDPENPAIWYEIYETVKHAAESSLKGRAAEALDKAWELSPRNLHVFRERLLQLAQGDRENRKSDPRVADMFTAGRDLLAPFVRNARVFARVELLELLDSGVAGAEAEEYDTVIGSAFRISNVLLREVAAQNDRKRVYRHHLEFAVHDFSPQFFEGVSAPKQDFAPEIDVSLERAETPLSNVSDVRSAQLIDFDLDGRQDLFLVHEDRVSIWSRAQDSEQWAEIYSLEVGPGLIGAHLCDMDRDFETLTFEVDGKSHAYSEADLDAIVFGAGGIYVLRNEQDAESGSRSLVLVEQSTEFQAVRDVLAVLAVDFDHDGDLDLTVSSSAGLSLWLNAENSTFTQNSDYSVLPPADSQIHKMIAVDWDRNVSIDVLCLGKDTSGYMENLLHGRMRWQSFSDDALLKNSSGLALLESDANFSWDLLATGDESLTLYRTSNPDAGVVSFLEPESVGTSGASDVLTWDYDNDGFVDAASWQGRTIKVVRGGPLAQFKQATTLTTELPSDIVSADAGDIDADGDIDLVIVCTDSIELLINQGGNANQWIDLPIRAEAANQAQKPNERVNLHGIGSLVELKSGSHYQTQVVTGRSTHFGLGRRSGVDSIRVLWTNGVPEHVIDMQPGAMVYLQQDLKGSCPYLYTWDGEKFSFYTDCLWAAPIGLQLADGVLAPPREWEYLKIDGDRLKEKDGQYLLRMTEELWEIGYFDSVRLLEVVHPDDVDIYSNEKVGPAAISEFHIHTVKEPRVPVAAHDQAGRDVLSKISAQDDDWLQCWDRRIKQGLTEPHFIELDLGGLKDPQKITLFMTGWIRPTDTSLNVAITQRPDLESTSPPSVHVPGEDGRWIQVNPFMGFPGGKTKTISIDLSNAFSTDDYRVRIATSMEIYWDHVFFTVDEEDAEVRVTEMPLVSADLRYRGFSKKLRSTELGPELYDYGTIATRPHWPPMEGRLTAYGDVLSLVKKTDDDQVAMGAGDEMELRFRAESADLPDGWTRDFILHNVGWDKDADLNTVFGQSVDPLPFAGMKGYPDPVGKDGGPPFADQRRSQSRSKFWRFFFDESMYRISN